MPAPNNEAIYKKKAAENFAAAKLLQKSHPNASASRLYYAGFLGAVGEYEKMGVQPQCIDSGAAQSFKERGVKWTHSFVRNNARMIHLDDRQSHALKWAYEIRTKADYETEEVSAVTLQLLMTQIEDILVCLGVRIGA